jgi:hypothetical protein
MSAGCSGGTLGYDLAQQAEEAERRLPPGHLRRLLGAAQAQSYSWLSYQAGELLAIPTLGRLGAYEQTSNTAVTPEHAVNSPTTPTSNTTTAAADAEKDGYNNLAMCHGERQHQQPPGQQ